MTTAEQDPIELESKFPWDAIPVLLGAVSGLSLFLSIIFDMGYFETIGLHFADIPTSISDHVRSALLWVPQAALATVVYIVFSLMSSTFGDLLRLSGTNSDGKPGTAFTSLKIWVNRAVIVVAFLVFWFDLLTGGRLGRYGAVASTVVLTYIVFGLVSRISSSRPHSPAKRLALFLLPVVTVLVYNTGVSRAIEERDAPRKATITVEGPRELNLTIYRYLDRGVLAGNGQGKLFFYRWEDVKSLTATFQPPTHKNWLCLSIGVACIQAMKPPVSQASATLP